MTAPRIVISRRRFLAGKTVWVVGIISIVVLIGTIIQMRMTWTRERTRGITSDAVDLFQTVKADIGSILPTEREVAPLTEIITSPQTSVPAQANP